MGIFRVGGLLAALSCSVSTASAAQLVLIVRSGGNSWAFQAAEKITVNGKDRLRSGSAQKLKLLADDYKRLPAEQLLRMGMLRRNAEGYLVHWNGTVWNPVAPDGVNLKSGTSTTYAELWKSAAVAYQTDRNSKSLAQLKSGEVVFAILPATDADEAVVSFISNETNFRGVGEANPRVAFEERMSLLEYAAQKIHGAQAERLQEILLSKMGEADKKVNASLAHKSDLDDGLDYVKVSERAYQSEPRHQQLRNSLINTDLWLARRVAILRAFAAGQWWDDFLLKYGEFDRWRNSFDDIAKLKDKAFSESARQHMESGKQREDAKQWALALEEYKTAKLRDPSNRRIDELILNAKTADDRESPKPPPVDMKSQAQRLITKYLSDANYAITDDRLDEAEKKIDLAGTQDTTSIRVLLARADLLRAKKGFQPALELLDDYDRRASSEDEFNKGVDLRSRVQREFTKRKDELTAAVEKAKADGDYLAARELSLAGVKLDPRNLDFLHGAGITSAALRQKAEAVRYMQDYLKWLSLTPGIDDNRLGSAYDELKVVRMTVPEAQGAANWFSGYKSAPGVFYCPISLMPNARIAEIKTSPKQTTSFRWDGDQLAEIDTRDAVAPANNSTVWFEYFKNQKSVWRVAQSKPDPKDDRPSRFLYTSHGTDPAPTPGVSSPGKAKWSYFTLLNHPDVDPVMVAQLMNGHIAIIVAGNPYFHPFVWSRICKFLAEYDAQGRVKSVQQLASAEQTGVPGDTTLHNFEFQWDGQYLKKISETGTGDYQRDMNYTGGKLMSESVHFQGKTSEIKYTYVGDRLTTAKSGEDASLNGRSREVTFR